MVKLAIAGFGSIGRVHLANLSSMRGCQVTGIFDSNPEAMRTADPSIRRYRDLEELTADSGVEAVVIATPSDSHLTVARAALAAGKHIFVEKPLAGTLADSREIVETAASRQSLRAQAGFCERFNPQYLEAKRAVSSGVLGEVRAVRGSRVAPYSLGNTAWDLGILDTAVHNLDLILWLKGHAPRWVQAFGAQVYPDSNIPHSVTTILRFDDGSMATDHMSPGSRTMPTRCTSVRVPPCAFRHAWYVRDRSGVTAIQPVNGSRLCGNRLRNSRGTRILCCSQIAVRSISAEH